MFLRLFNNKALMISIMTIGVSVLLQIAFIRFASYSIDRVDYGNFVLIQTLLSGLALIFLQMPIQAFDRFYNESSDKKVSISEFKTLIIGLSSLSFIVIIVYGLLFDKFSSTLLFTIYILFIFIANYTINQRIFLLNMQRDKYFYVRTMEASAKFLIPILSYYLFHSLLSLFIGMALGYGVSLLVLHLFLNNYKTKIIIVWKNIKQYFVYSYPMFFFALFAWGISFSDRYFIEYFLNTEDVGIYGLLGMVAGMGQIIGQIYYIYVEPIILKQHSIDEESAYRLLNRYILTLSGVFVMLTILALVIPKSVYTLLLDPLLVHNEYYFITMIILLVTIFIGIIHTAHHMHFKLIKRLDILAYIYLVALFINLIGNSFIEEYGIMAAAISTLLAYITILVLQMIYVFIYKKGCLSI